MKNLVIVFFLILSFQVFAQTSVSLSFNTGDAEIDAHLNDINNYASADISIFRKDLALSFRASNYDMDIYLVKERMRPADVYYGYVLSYTTGRPFPEVMKIYKKKRGWGSIAKELGIKPGSDEFHRLKNSALRSIEKEKIKGKKDKVNKNKLSSGNNKKNNGKNKSK